jgi:hypothetical protein
MYARVWLSGAPSRVLQIDGIEDSSWIDYQGRKDRSIRRTYLRKKGPA